MKQIIRYAFVQTLPVLFGYLFMGIAFGVLLQQAGYSFVWAFFISLTCYAGSMQFVLIELLTGGYGLLRCAFMTLMVNFRHIFYGLSLIEKFKGMGKAFPYMIHSLTDETYSLLCLVKPLPGMNEKRMMFTIALLDQLYWITGCVLGALAGTLITFDTTGIDFAMTALFVVIFVEQWKESRTHVPALVGLVCAIGSLVVCKMIGQVDNFLLPALVLTVLILLSLRGRLPLDGKEEA